LVPFSGHSSPKPSHGAPPSYLGKLSHLRQLQHLSAHKNSISVTEKSEKSPTGWWFTYPAEKYESQLGSLFPTEWKNNPNVPVTTNQITIIFP